MILKDPASHHERANTRPRRRAQHSKSRSGCVNCRYRRVKCGEEKPQCRRCRDYMVQCSYTNDAADLSIRGEAIVGDMLDSGWHTSPSMSPEVWPSPILVHPSLDWQHEIIYRFRNRTALTMGSPSTVRIYATAVPRLAMEHEHLLHAIAATTLLHDHALGTAAPRLGGSESFHLGQAAAKFGKKLAQPLIEGDRDALWATAVYMCATAVYNIKTTDPEKSWPLSPDPEHLEWLNLQAGLRVIWRVADLHRPTSAFAYVGKCTEGNCVFPIVPGSGIIGLPSLLVDLCDLRQCSDSRTNPYHSAVWYLSWLIPIQCTPSNVLTFMIFAGGVTKEFRELLEQRDPRALLLMAIWYSRLFNSSWWMVPRAKAECQAIYLYLQRLQIRSTMFQRVLDLVESTLNQCSLGALDEMTLSTALVL